MRRGGRTAPIAVLWAAASVAGLAAWNYADVIEANTSALSAQLGAIAEAVRREVLIAEAHAGKKKNKNKNRRGKSGRDDGDSSDWDDDKGGGWPSASGGNGSSGSGNQNWQSGTNNPGASSGGGNSGSKDDWPKAAGAPGTGPNKLTRAKGNKDQVSEPSGDDSDEEESSAPEETLERVLKKAAKPNAKIKRRPTINDFNPDVPSDPNGNEILAANLSGEDVAKAQALGFKPVATTSMTGIGLNVTRLVSPSSLGRSAARELLATHLKRANFESNQTHIIYEPAGDEAQAARDSNAPPGLRAGQCREDRCFGRVSVCWNDDLSMKAKRLKIGIIDTPVDLDHPAFAGQKINIGSFLGTGRRSDTEWHGTAVLSILAGRLDSGVPGLVPEATYYVAEAFHSIEQGVATTDSASILKALDWLDSQNVQIINMSFSGPKDILIEQVINRMRAKGVTFVAAAGNFGAAATPSYPAAYKEVIAVTAVDKSDNSYISANHGHYIDIAAPGVKIWTALAGKKEGYRNGTSFAAPFGTALLAAAIAPGAVRKGEADDLRLIKTVDLGPPGIDTIFGRGLAVGDRTCRSNIARTTPPDRPINASASPSFGETVVVPAPTSASAFGP